MTFWIGTAIGVFLGVAIALFGFGLWILRRGIWPG